MYTHTHTDTRTRRIQTQREARRNKFAKLWHEREEMMVEDALATTVRYLDTLNGKSKVHKRRDAVVDQLHANLSGKKERETLQERTAENKN